MFGRLFGDKAKPAPAPEGHGFQIGDELFARAQAAADLIGPATLSIATTEQGVHVESMLVALGAVAGYACQVAARIAPPAFDPALERTPLVEVRANGATYFFGDAINHYLLETPQSFWSLAAGGVVRLGPYPIPDIEEIVGHVAATVGQDPAGVIRFPAGASAAHPPAYYLRELWPRTREQLAQAGLAPEHWSIGFGVAAQIALMMVKPVVEPTGALSILAEAAVLSSKMDPVPLGLAIE